MIVSKPLLRFGSDIANANANTISIETIADVNVLYIFK